MTEPRKPIVEMPLRVRYHECDGQGIVFNAHYLAYVDMAMFEVEKALFGSHQEAVARGVDVVVAESNLRYRAPCRYDDELVVAVYLNHLGTTSLIIDFEITRDGRLCAEVKTRYVFVDPATLTKAAPPAAVREAYAAFVPAQAD
ncbi:acyl-CoA thioesterase [Amycolatopsis sp. WAC 04169]|uniref:4-hydroxybenzoyl-CoA thioesterase n=1 Tax=Amycolatopsis keratiniphila subsp. keratiniphila TaxID=227715 RepID=A0A1W2LP20_9PSEU|nr:MULTISPECIES: thioesterase family protein [Amycolatopsis]OLZ49513.1 4-hydroxybenzoyl-CoA thioesterase [Amycolatopsis keratiniphila subsp. nogabecina]ONF65023.1 4-hydroxybenzoyl-CoA thioesterase [Amycolatopsis keratiniphila subsp. keratiniphila]RSN24669.1 acyl-CoA thioesterase [Amycolatopsis sp. WAC 04169]SDU20573.1 (3S)-malyl-CoA thioesterase [Amycolatopsis keratiniphila]